MSKFQVNFYRDIDGSKPVGLFIRTLDVKMKAKVVANLHLLEEYGNLLENLFQKSWKMVYLNYVVVKEIT